MNEQTYKLKRIARYRVMLPEFLPGSDQERFISEAALAGLVTFHHKQNGGAIGGCSWLQPTAKGCALVGVPLTRSEPMSEAAVRSHLPNCWLCHAYGESMELLETSEVKSLLGCSVPANLSFVAAKEGVIYRVYASSTSVLKTAQKARSIIDELTANDTTRPLVRSGVLGVAILVESPPKADSVTEALRKKDAGVSLDELARFVVRLYPKPNTLAPMLKRLRESRG